MIAAESEVHALLQASPFPLTHIQIGDDFDVHGFRSHDHFCGLMPLCRDRHQFKDLCELTSFHKIAMLQRHPNIV